MSCVIIEPISLGYYVGDTAAITITVTNADGTAYNLTGCGLRLTATDNSVSPAATRWDLTIGSGITVTSLAGGTAIARPTLLDSQSLVAGRSIDTRCILTDADGQIITTASGTITAL